MCFSSFRKTCRSTLRLVRIGMICVNLDGEESELWLLVCSLKVSFEIFVGNVWREKGSWDSKCDSSSSVKIALSQDFFATLNELEARTDVLTQFLIQKSESFRWIGVSSDGIFSKFFRFSRNLKKGCLQVKETVAAGLLPLAIPADLVDRTRHRAMAEAASRAAAEAASRAAESRDCPTRAS